MTAQELFNAIFNGSLALMLLTLVGGLGLGLTVRQILEPLKRVWVLVAALVVNLLLAPLIAIGICHLFSLSTEARIGVVLCTVAAGGPTGLKCAQLARRSDMAMALSLTIVLILLDIVAAPLWTEQVVSGASLDPWDIVENLTLLILVPLVIGLVLHWRYPKHASEWQPGLGKISNMALLVAILFGVAANWGPMADTLGSRVLIASAVISVVFVVVGWLAGRVGDDRAAITNAMVASTRFQPVGLLVIGTALHNNSAYLAPGLVFALVNTVVPVVVGLEIGRAVRRHETSPAAVPASQSIPDKTSPAGA